MMASFFTSKKFILGASAFVVIVGALFASIHFVKSNRLHVAQNAAVQILVSEAVQTEQKIPEPELSQPPVITHVVLPEEVRGIYWTAFTAATNRADELIAYMQKTGLNTVVIDLKMDNGQIAFKPNDASLLPYTMQKPAIKDLDGLLKKLADDHIYRIARIAVMRDGTFASIKTSSALKTAGGLWKDKTGSGWIDPASPDVVPYAIALAKEAYARGFDEVQFDYVRFASDGKIHAITYPYFNGTDVKTDVMKKFYTAVGQAMKKDQIPVSFDLFGLVCMTNDGLGIGQRLEDVMPNTDFVSPMVYPSHYANGFQGFQNPALYPFDVIHISLDHALLQLLPPKIETSSVKNADGTETKTTKTIQPTLEERLSIAKKFRPWIQDFDIGAVYTADKIEAQIKAVRESGASGFLIWNARNVYEPAHYVK